MWMPRKGLCRSRWSLDSVFCGTCPAPYVCDLQSRMARQVPRMPWHPVPRRAALVVLAGRCFDLQSADFLCFIIRKRRLALDVCIGFLQCGIPHRMCRFYCCLAAHQRTKEKDSAEPLSSILWTPPPHPGVSAAAGKCRLPRAWGNVGSCIPVQIAHPQFDVSFGGIVFGLGLFAFQSISLGFGRTFFIIGGMDCTFLRLRGVLPWICVELPLTAPFLPISLGASSFHQ